MGYLAMIEKAMNSYNPLSLSMLESYWGGGNSISELQSTRKYYLLRQYDTIVLSFFVYFLENDKICLCGLV